MNGHRRAGVLLVAAVALTACGVAQRADVGTLPAPAGDPGAPAVAAAAPSDDTAPADVRADDTGPADVRAIALSSRPGGRTDAVAGRATPIVASIVAADPIARLELYANGELVLEHHFATPAVDPLHVFEWTPVEVGFTAVDVRAIDVNGAVTDAAPLWLSALADPDAASPPAARAPATPLVVAVDPGACVAEITIDTGGSAPQYSVHAATVGSPRYVAFDLAVVPGATSQVPLADTPVVVRVDAHGDAAASQRAVLDGVEGCSRGSWSGALRLVDGMLVGAAEVDVAYLYLTVDGTSWTRVPAGDGEFVPRGRAGFDFARHLAGQLDGATVIDFEAWGWHGGELVPLGSGRYEPGAADGPWPLFPFSVISPSQLVMVHEVFVDGVFEVTSTDGVLCPPTPGSYLGCIDEPTHFRWTGFPSGTTAGLLQVAQVRFPSSSQVSPVGLLYAETIALDGATVLDVTLDLRVAAGLATDAPPGSFVDAQLGFQDLQLIQLDLSVADGPGGPRRSSTAFTAPPLRPPHELFVRIVPLAGGQPTAGASNRVRIGLDAEPIVFQDIFAADVQVSIDMPRLSNYGFHRCVRIVDNPFGTQNPTPSQLGQTQGGVVGELFQAPYDEVRDRARTWIDGAEVANGLERGATVCAVIPNPPSGNWYDFIGDVVAFAVLSWDSWVYVWGMLQEKLVEGLIYVTGCAPEDICKAVASTVLTAAMIAVGLPPTMPKFSDLMAIAKGELAEVAAAYIVEESGLCPQGLTATCQEVVDEAVAWVLDQIQEQASNIAMSTATSGGYTLHLNPDIRVVTEPAGMVHFGFAEVTVTRPLAANLPPNAICPVNFRVTATHQVQWKEPNGTAHDQLVTESVVTPTFAVIDLAALAPGESTTIVLVPTDFDRWPHLTGANQQQLQNAYDKMETWRHIFKPGAALTATVEVCGQVVTQTGSLSLTPTLPSDLATPPVTL